MEDNALYVYGVVKLGDFIVWESIGLNDEKVYAVNEGNFSALVHDCEEKPYISEEPNKIKELIITHNNILDMVMEEFGGVIPLHFNTIIKKGENSAQDALKKWINDNIERLEKIWNKVEGKKEYGIRIYYEKDKLMQEISYDKEIKEIEESMQEKSQGLKYLLQSKAKSKIYEIAQNRINQFKRKFYDELKRVSDDIKVNTSRIFIDEEKDLLLNLSVLVDKQQSNKIRKTLVQKAGGDFSIQLAGPFAPYSFVEDETK